MRKRAMGSKFTMRKSDGVRNDHAKKWDRVRIYHEKE